MVMPSVIIVSVIGITIFTLCTENIVVLTNDNGFVDDSPGFFFISYSSIFLSNAICLIFSVAVKNRGKKPVLQATEKKSRLQRKKWLFF